MRLELQNQLEDMHQVIIDNDGGPFRDVEAFLSARIDGSSQYLMDDLAAY